MGVTNRLVERERYDSHIVVRLFVARWHWILSSICAFTVIFAVLYCFIPPTYRASTLLMPVSFERGQMSSAVGSAIGQFGGFASLAGISLRTDATSTEEALAVLTSREFTEKFINDLNLMPELYSKKWSAKRHAWRGGVRDWPTENQAYNYFNLKVRKVLRDKTSGLVTLQINWKNRLAAARWANVLVERLNSNMRHRAIQRADASIGFLKNAMQKTSDIEIRLAISRLIETEIKNRMLADVNHEYAFRVIDPAVAPDEDMPIWPKKAFFIIAGPLIGLLVGMILIIVAELVKRETSK